MDSVEVDFRDILAEELEKRVLKNPSYSLRAFARDLKLSPSHLSQIVRGKEGLSRLSALRVAQSIYQDQINIDHFCNMVEVQHGRSWALREVAIKSLTELWKKNKKELSPEAFSKVMNWYHLAILHLCDLKQFQTNPSWIAKYLGISIEEATLAIEQLVELGLLENSPEGLIRKQGAFIHSKYIPSDIIREYHRQILEKALFSIENQSIEERFLSAITLSVSLENLSEIKNSIKNFIEEIERITYKSQKFEKEELYCMSLQLFNLKCPIKE